MGWRHPKSTYFGLATCPVCGLQESLWGYQVRSSAKASRPLGTMVWNAEDARVPPGEKRGSGEGNLVLSSALWGSLMCPLAAGQGRPSGRRLQSKEQYH